MRWLARIATIIFLLAVLAYGLFFTLQNDAVAPLDLLFMRFDDQRIALWVLLAFTLGGLIGMAVSFIALWRLKSEQLMLKRKMSLAQKELDKLRSAVVKS